MNREFPDKILDINDLIENPAGVLENQQLIGSYLDYLKVNFYIHHGTHLADYTEIPTPGKQSEGQVKAFVDKGIWRWRCGACGNYYIIDKNNLQGLCLCCLWPGDKKWVGIELPKEFRTIEETLLKFPGYRTENHLRDWKPKWTMEYLHKRLERVREKQKTESAPNKLSIAPSRIVGIGEVVQVQYWNNNVVEPLDDLSGENGGIEFRSGIKTEGYTTSERDNISSPLSGFLLWNETDSTIQFYDGTAYKTMFSDDDLRIIEERMTELSLEWVQDNIL